MADADRIVIVGAGVAGLSCARALADAGRSVVVVERARGVGGRCATRRIEGQAVDFGLHFYHGKDRGFLAALDAVPSPAIPGWPLVVQGTGRPCQPSAFSPGERRVAFVDGVSMFPKHLARGLDLRRGERLISFAVEGDAFSLDFEGARAARAATIVLALAIEQSLSLLGATPSVAPELDTARALLEMCHTEPCLTVIAFYEWPSTAEAAWSGAPEPPWHVLYPGDSRILQAVVHDSSKRVAPEFLGIVYQAQPQWSREHLADDDWQDAMLAEGARLLGPWAKAPALCQTHRWSYARSTLAAELAAPPMFRLGHGLRLGLVGENFAPGGGAEAAYLSGLYLAKRIITEDSR